MVFLLVACSGTSNHQASKVLHIDELIIRNATSETITDVELNDIDAKTHIACSVILAKSMCSLGFQKIPLEDHETYLSWKQNQANYTEKVKSHSIPITSNAKVFIDILDKGRLSVSVK